MRKEELQDQNDELRLELERTKEAAELGKLRLEVKELREEVPKLQKELEASERRRSQLQGELETLNKTTEHLRESYEQGQQRLLGMIRDKAREMAEAAERWEAEKAELQKQLNEARAETAQQATLAKNYNKQVLWQLEEMAKLRRALESAGPVGAEAEIVRKDREIEGLNQRIWQLTQEVRLGRRPFLIELAAMLVSSPGRWLATMCLLGILILLLYQRVI
jgi:chromosome segregation ATPase